MRLTILLLTSLVTAGTAWPQQTSPLTLREAIEIALRQNPSISAAREAVAESEARLGQARADYYPQIGSSGLAKAGLSGALNGLQPAGLPNSPFYRNFADAFNIYHPGLDFGRTKHSVRITRRRGEALRADLEAAQASVILETSRAFYRVLEARKLEQAAKQAVASRETTLRQARAFYEGEIRSKVDFSLARVGLAEAQLRSLEAGNRRRVALAELANALGSSQNNYELSEPDLALPELAPLPSLIEQAYQHRPELAALQARREAALEAIALARSQRKPMLSFFFSGGWARFMPLTASKLLAIGTGLKFPVYTFGKLGALIEEAEARLRLLDHELEGQRQQVALETCRTYYRLQNALESIPVRQVQLEASGEAVRLARARYREQLGTIVELTEAEASLAEAEANQASAVYAVKSAEAELRFATGQQAIRSEEPTPNASPPGGTS